ncbi:hypothetical protein B6U99_07310 [Candidatus Geothermarchaeota archaeon ex4572_27]|nr:MAG: hypothetical protein B6U99_07310 [Candidatus Geothermarchaeota archaeon ex4572_27]
MRQEEHIRQRVDRASPRDGGHSSPRRCGDERGVLSHHGEGVISFALSLASSIFVKGALDELGEASGEDLFRAAGLIYVVGAALTIVLIGPVLILAA